MNRDSVSWSGAMPAITTPFDDNGKIDERELGDVIDRHLALGATGVVVGGCTGEFWAMSAEERARLFASSKAVIGTRGTLIAGTGMIGVGETVALTLQAEKAGCDGALILPPYFVKLTDDEIHAHYADVTARIGDRKSVV